MLLDDEQNEHGEQRDGIGTASGNRIVIGVGV